MLSFVTNIGLNGLKIIEEIYNKKKDTVNILTHCNAGLARDYKLGYSNFSNLPCTQKRNS